MSIESIDWKQVGLFLDSCQVFYADKLRPIFFSGFLTLCSFLFALSTFIVVNVKKEVYDDKEYKRSVLKQAVQLAKMKTKGDKETTKPEDTNFYGPLVRLNKYLFSVIYLALATSVAQVTIGLIPHWTAALVCIVLVGFATWGLFSCLRLFKENLTNWFSFLEQKAVGERDTFLAELTKTEAGAAAAPNAEKG